MAIRLQDPDRFLQLSWVLHAIEEIIGFSLVLATREA